MPQTVPPRLSRILIYPVKSLDPISVQQARVLPSGALEHDRRFALVDQEGVFLTAKRAPLIHRVRCRFDRDALAISLQVDGHEERFHLHHDRQALDDWFST